MCPISTNKVPGRSQDPAVGCVLRHGPKGEHVVPLLQGDSNGGDALHGQGRLRRQLLQEAPQAQLPL
jgi:hypothetical protein